MNRRSTLKALAGGGIVAALGGGYHWLSKDRDHPSLALDFTLERLMAFQPGDAETSGDWEVARTFNHLAQSIEFSMDGFPIMKPELFRKTAGRLAFSVFQAQGRMTHGLSEEIPGEIVDSAQTDPAKAHERLIAALQRFDAYDKQLKPHFAYGQLEKSQYALAHVMHINNHFEEFKLA